jgi:periplasmic protein TonB
MADRAERPHHPLAWAPDAVDAARTKRLSTGIVVGLGVLTVLGVGAARIKAAPVEKDESVDVKLVASAPEEKPPPPPPPPPVPPPEHPKVVEPPKQATPPPPTPEEPPGPPGDGPGKPGEEGHAPGGGGTGTGPARPAPPPPPPIESAPPPPPPPPPKPQGPVQLPEDGVAPVAISNPAPGVPEEARKQGIEATVVVKFVVTESGSVTNVTIVRGHPLLDEVVLAIVKTWKYKPALVDGKPTAVYRTAKFPFRLKSD